MSELKPCPFCGELPEVECQGTFFDIQCCVSLSLQKCDYLTIKERETFDGENFFYSDEAEEKVRQIAEKIWNTRPIEDALRAEIDRIQNLLDAEIDANKELTIKNFNIEKELAGVKRENEKLKALCERLEDSITAYRKSNDELEKNLKRLQIERNIIDGKYHK